MYSSMCWMCHVRVVPLIDRTWSHVFCIGVDPGLGSQSHLTLSVVVVGVVVDEPSCVGVCSNWSICNSLLMLYRMEGL